jgi:TatA/E family protein of Tat protein translocase
MSFGAGHWPYIVILLVIVLIIWGPGKLPDLGSALGKGIREFRKATNDIKDSVVTTTAAEPTPAQQQQAAQPVVQATPPPAPAAGPVQPVQPAQPVGGPPPEHPSA